jgi:hypothetical protein
LNRISALWPHTVTGCGWHSTMTTARSGGAAFDQNERTQRRAALQVPKADTSLSSQAASGTACTPNSNRCFRRQPTLGIVACWRSRERIRSWSPTSHLSPSLILMDGYRLAPDWHGTAFALSRPHQARSSVWQKPGTGLPMTDNFKSSSKTCPLPKGTRTTFRAQTCMRLNERYHPTAPGAILKRRV